VSDHDEVRAFITDPVLQRRLAKYMVLQCFRNSMLAALAEYIHARRPNARGFSASNLWRMMQFYETYRGLPRLAPLVRVLSSTHNLLIMSRSKPDEEREFYLRLCAQERWSKRHWNGSLPERRN